MVSKQFGTSKGGNMDLKINEKIITVRGGADI